jgi:hypothetical protein
VCPDIDTERLMLLCDTTLRMAWGSLTRLLRQLSDVLIALLNLQTKGLLVRAGRGIRTGRIEQIMRTIDLACVLSLAH